MLYQIVERKRNENTAASKAVNDVSIVADQLGFNAVYILDKPTRNLFDRVAKQLSYAFQWFRVCRKIEKGSIILIQNPIRNTQLLRVASLNWLKKHKNIKIISLIHDVEKLRGYMYNRHYEKEFNDMLNTADVYIVHNEVMKNYFVECGVDESRLIDLEIFDYLTNLNEATAVSFSKHIYLAGNLDPAKSGYISKLSTIEDVEFVLYGINFPAELANESNIDYRGVVEAEKLPNLLNEGFGLVWDGNEVDSCSGGTGEYLQYNNPHKLSLYLASGMPVVIWERAAEAAFVRKHELGITVGSIRDVGGILNRLSKEEYENMQRNVKNISQKLMSGKYTAVALESALDLLKT